MKKIWATFFYFLSLVILGFFISNLSKIDSPLGNFRAELWFICFVILTCSFHTPRQIIKSLINFNVLKQPATYFYIVLSLLLPYVLLMLCVNYEILLDKRLIYFYKHGLFQQQDTLAIIHATILNPIWEELFFRGVLLFSLLKLMKPIWAISLTSILFALFHPSYWIVTLLSGILLSLLTYKTKSIIPAILSHALWNFYIAYLFFYFS
ncbi:CPBP family intramembrane metalloprotease [Aquibacillus koreensis]|uniref:CPBP family intramembrane metalloprotease n=1 Tax=Aquibacillus koreensis TaxID=279446 RepID=A0A9X4ALP9_9BACI|nr:CPBP family intramembrane glutamic endopeptidase [Aquibacillus koreensis]MCT2535479.1 CPBP family intramembrane metalloprotease [Aquibacillus koreensis]MDC3422708.1 CPBP family intramembrane metalloprotease [Aquibacillus koreensis]